LPTSKSLAGNLSQGLVGAWRPAHLDDHQFVFCSFVSSQRTRIEKKDRTLS
jgi:hypothetical protein